jgi:FkbM family methyltransferase
MICYLKLDNFIIYFNMRSPEIGTFKEIFVDQVYEREQEFIPQKGWTVLDLGANIGVFSLRAASKMGNGNIIAFEPNYELYYILMMNARANNIQSIKFFPIAFGGNEDIKDLIVSKYSTGNGSIMGWRYEKLINGGCYIKYPVIIETLDHFFEKMKLCGNIDLIKIDIEGAEYEAICGANNILDITKRIVMEFHDNELFDKITKRLSEKGFTCIRILKESNIAYFLKQ